ncbi:hypothetical protein Slin15195_G037560 [Septoria linicola]|uniref:Uncharacterized protein n=1 Tax=Septoria linicola TaxID=215465 RepID=A0A9Q9AJE2_9PEZI|nr:hypothetical protein Slin14017_G118970 [Septoria linicola]USW50437.1 hypothetical protein Slin15195_G037560 [Septoria linicola]
MSLASLIKDNPDQVETHLIRAIAAYMSARATGRFAMSVPAARRKEIRRTMFTCQDIIDSIKTGEVTGREGNRAEVEEADPDAPDPDTIKPTATDEMVKNAIMGMFDVNGKMKGYEHDENGLVVYLNE